jgi:gas vesicle protein
MKWTWRDLKAMDKDDYLGLLGLQSKRSFTGQLLGGLGIFGLGLLVGAGVALLVAPKAGRELRGDLRSKMQRGKGAAETARSQVESEIAPGT